ncbi:hypothetical protein GCM10022263_20620 [Nocardioides daeguensis]|uniref:Uncharacterized protein n=1 Tax=Nocardioides daeguensis TaxID=908359 RepID=A0ABP6VAB0_9ACTN
MSRRHKPRQQAQGSRYQQARRNAARSKPTREPEDGPGFGGGDGGLDPAVDLALAQLFRRECSDCGSQRLRWFVGADADSVLGSAPRAPGRRGRARRRGRRARPRASARRSHPNPGSGSCRRTPSRAEAMLVQMPDEWRAAADCWVCLRCGESGAFGPSEWEPF